MCLATDSSRLSSFKTFIIPAEGPHGPPARQTSRSCPVVAGFQVIIGGRFWVITEGGVRDILIACCDGLKGFPEAIEAVFPQAVVQTCIVHMIRNSLRFVSYKDRKAVAKELRPVYTAASREEAQVALDSFDQKWARRYPMIASSWRTNWERVVPFLDFPPDVRRVIYTTNAIESLNSTLRKLLQYRRHFPTDEGDIARSCGSRRSEKAAYLSG